MRLAGPVVAASFVLMTAVSSLAADFYVNGANTSPAAPYDSPEKAATTIADALAAAKDEIAASGGSAVVHVAVGTYDETGFTLDGPIAVVGDSRDDVIVNSAVAGKRAFTLSHADASVRNLTITGTGLRKNGGQGGHVWMSAGRVEGCVIQGGIVAADNGYGYGGNVYMTGGRLVRCRVLNGATTRSGWSADSYGAGIYATGGIIDSCLVKGGHGVQQAYCGGVYLNGEVTLVNCTVTENSAPKTGTIGVGVHVASAKAKVLNCVIYGNGGTPVDEFGSVNLSRFRFCASTVTNASCATWLLIGATDFADSRLNGDYRIRPGSRLVDAGSDSDEFYPADASEYDIDGNDRKSGTAIDIGFSEVNQSTFSFNGHPSTYGAFVNTSVTFRAFSAGATGPVKYKWRFGDGTETETDLAAFDYSYPACGLYNVSLAASDDNGTTWTEWCDVPIQVRVSPAEVFVNASSPSPSYPYATRDTGAHTIAEALLSLTNNLSRGLAYGEGVKVRVCTGTYTETGFELNYGVTVCGDTGNPADVTIVDEVVNTRAFALDHPDARVEDLTISGKGLRSNKNGVAEGGHVRMTAGTIENCIISGGRAAGDNGNTWGNGGNVHMTGGRLLRCLITGGAAKVTWCGNTSYGSGVYAAGGLIDSCIIKDNKGESISSCGGAYLDGPATLANCLVVGNIAPYDTDAIGIGIHLANKDARVINTIVLNSRKSSDDQDETAVKNYGTKNLANYINCASLTANAGGTDCKTVSESDFAQCSSGDYHLLKTSDLVDGGVDRFAYTSLACSDRDFDGLNRVSGKAIDIGCYEYDQDSKSCSGALSTYGALRGADVVFTAMPSGMSGAVTYEWDFGDGTGTTTESEVMTHAYSSCGNFVVLVRASDDGGSTWTDWQKTASDIVVVPAVTYVDATNANPQAPYDTKETAANTIGAVLATMTNGASANTACVSGAVVRVCRGELAESGIVLKSAISIVGDTGNPADVTIVDEVVNTRAFALDHPDARVEDLTISGKGLRSNKNGVAEGGHVRMTAGTIENCIISGGQAAKGTGNTWGNGGNVYMTGGRLLRCLIAGGAATVTWCGSTSYGSGVYAAGGLIDSCIIKDNKGESISSCGGAYLVGPATLANCLVVGNIAPYDTDAIGIGIHLANKDARVINTIVLNSRKSSDDQDETAVKNYGTKNLANYINCASLTANAGGTDCKTVSEADFAQYSSGDYHLLKTSDLIDGGVDRSDYTSLACSDRDFDGLNRVSGTAIDIGCYEYDQDSKSCGGALSTYGALRGADVVFTAMPSGMSGAVTYEWDFGDGTGTTTESEVMTHAYSSCGNFVVLVRGSDDGGSTWTDWQKTASDIVVAPAVTYVDAANANPQAPYDTKETAANTIGAVLATMTNGASANTACVSGAVVRVCRGELAESGIVLKSAISIVGDTGNPADVVIVDSRAGSRAFTIEHTGARVANLTVCGTGLGVNAGEGGHVRMTAGEVANCVISNGIAGAFDHHGYGGNVYMAGGRLRNCQILGGSAAGLGWCGEISCGSGVWASGGVVENCLIKDNLGKSNTVGGGVCLSGGAVAVNCTIVGNTSGTASRGMGIESGAARAVNCVIFGNGTAAGSEFGTAYLGRYSYCASSEANPEATGWQVIDEAAFRDYGQKDVKLKSLQPVRGGALHNTGSDWNTYQGLGAVSKVDLLGQNRKGGRRLDIGCFELSGGGTMLLVQ